jgi:arylsulfatase A
MFHHYSSTFASSRLCASLFLFALSSQLFAASPNIVFILADDLGYGDVGCYGATKVKTPNIDKLASEGRRFTDAHSASAVCTPSRYALLTGEYPFRKNIWGPIMNTGKLLIDVKQPTIASMLKSSGYSTACFGKWHLGFGSEPNNDWNKDLKPGPLELGFDYYFGIPVVNSHPPFVWVENHRVVGLDPDDPLKYGGIPSTQQFEEKMMKPAMSGGKAAHDLYRDEEVGTSLTEKAVTWMRQQNDKPFFLYFATPHIHHPFTPGSKFKNSSEAAKYGDFIQEFDWMVGELLKTIDEMGQRDNTLIILTSDNGGMLNIGGQEAWKEGRRLNGDLLGFKFDAWEGGHRVPFIARWPKKIAAGSVSNDLVCQIDMLATLAELIGSKTTAPDSINLLPAIIGNPEKPLRDHLVIAPSKKSNLAIREGKWIYIGAKGGGGFSNNKVGEHALGGPAALKFANQANSDVVDGEFKADAPSEQLYDLSSDLSQSRNLINDHPEIAARLKARLVEIQSNASSINSQ